jgi:hypothetical protein
MALTISPHLVSQALPKSEHNGILTCCPSINGVMDVLITIIWHIEFITPIFYHPIMNDAASNNNVYLSFIREKR